MKHLKKHIWIEFEHFDEGKQWDKEDVRFEVIVTFENKERRIATFYTFKHLETKRKQYREEKNYLNGTCDWFSNIVFVDIATREQVEKVIELIMNRYQFLNVFEEYSEYDEEDEDEEIVYPDGFFTK